MAIVSSLFGRSRNHRLSRACVVVMIAGAHLLSGCQNLKTRNEIGRPAKSSGAAGEGGFSGGPSGAAPAPPILPPQPPSYPQGSPPAPTFLNRELPKVGLILGPGGMKSHAHLGVLREFARARIPVHAVVGLEWGSLMGLLYAQQGQVNDAEWKVFKLREEDFVAEGGLIESIANSSRSRGAPIGQLNAFLDTVVGSGAVERGKVKFACPAYWSKVDRAGMMSKGSAKDALRACLPYPPLFADNTGVWASPFAIDEAVTHLRAQGANLIVLVNVLGTGEILSAKMAGERPSDQILWSEVRREMLRARSPFVHYTIHVPTAGHPIDDYGGRRALIEAGVRASKDVISKLTSLYGF